MRFDPTGRTIALCLAMALLTACSTAMGGDPDRVEQEAGERAGQGEANPEGEAEGQGQDGDGEGEGEGIEIDARAPLPIVLLPGAAGFDELGPLEYYYGVSGDLTEAGHQVFATDVSPLQTIEVRAEQLAEQIDAFLAETGAERVHLIAHSQGGLDARFLISSLGYGDRVATLTTIATPHLGSRVADVALGIIPGPVEELLGFLIDFIVGAVDGSEQDVVAQLYQLTEEHAVEFNAANPDDPRVAYYSVAGITQLDPLADPFENDVCDPLFLASFALLDPHGPSDGLVPVESATYGNFLGTVPADHLDEVGQLFGTTALGFDHRDFYLALAAFLTDPAAPPPL
jgi:triacylglycerol esterase/lipase EstA (alpha/beta hydrolase family)